MSMLKGVLGTPSGDRVQGVIARVALRTQGPQLQVFSVLLEANPTVYAVPDKATNAGFPVGLSDRGDEISFEVGTDGRVINGTFRNLTVERNNAALAQAPIITSGK